MGLRNNIKSSINAFICGALIANLSVGSLISASAWSRSSGTTVFATVGNYEYGSYYYIISGRDGRGNYATGGSVIEVQSGGTPPSGHMAAMARGIFL